MSTLSVRLPESLKKKINEFAEKANKQKLNNIMDQAPDMEHEKCDKL